MSGNARSTSEQAGLAPGRPDGPGHELLVRAARGGFLSPSLDGGLPLLELVNPSRRSSPRLRQGCV
jgi:hypothetical protein